MLNDVPNRPDTLNAFDEVAHLRTENALLRASLAVSVQSKPTPQQAPLSGTMRSLVSLRRHKRTVPEPGPEWNSAQDTRYAHQSSSFNNVLHVFNKQWLGIRAAAGSLPGQKLAIDANRKLTRDELRNLIAECDRKRIHRYVFHGMSEGLIQIIKTLAGAGLSSQLFVVYHGNVVQWCFEPEFALASAAIDLARNGAVKKLHFMKSDHDVLVSNSHAPLLLNLTPLVGETGQQKKHAIAFIPGSSDWRKNLHSNALGAALSPSITKVIHYSRSINLPAPFDRKLEHADFIDRQSTLRLMSFARATLNVSLVECHPMVALESEAVSTPCLRARLNLDTLEDHPYVKLVEVHDFASPREISKVLDRVLAVPQHELQSMIADYSAQMNGVAIHRYQEFLDL